MRGMAQGRVPDKAREVIESLVFAAAVWAVVWMWCALAVMYQ